LYIKEKSAKIIGKNISLFWTFHFPAHKKPNSVLATQSKESARQNKETKNSMTDLAQQDGMLRR